MVLLTYFAVHSANGLACCRIVDACLFLVEKKSRKNKEFS